MSELLKRMRFEIVPNGSKIQSVMKWANFVVFPVLIMFLLLYKSLSLATNPFEEFIGTMVSVGFGLLWVIFVTVVSSREYKFSEKS